MIQWHEEINETWHAVWVADSPFHNGNGKRFKFRIVQRLLNNQRIPSNSIVYACESDPECCGDCGDFWPTLDEAKAAMEEMNETILREAENAK